MENLQGKIEESSREGLWRKITNTKITNWWTEDKRRVVKEKKTARKRYIQTEEIALKESMKTGRKWGEEITDVHKINRRVLDENQEIKREEKGSPKRNEK